MSMDINQLRNRIDETTGPLGASLIKWRRHLHRHPELRFVEFQTSEYIANLLSTIGLKPIRAARTGLIALLEGNKPGPTIALRVDMDALPMNDEKEVPYKSSSPGCCHACGHDVHMTVATGVAHVLTKLRGQMHGQVKFIFQPAEEIPSGEPSGAKAMIEEGALVNPDVSAIFGMHCWPELKAGLIGLQRGCTMASADSLVITLVGQGAHAGTPQHGRDAILAAAQVVQAMYMVSAREVSPNEAHTLSIGTIRGGQSQSIICDRVDMTGTLRTTSRPLRDRLVERLGNVVKEVAGATRCEGSLQVADNFPPVMNDDRLFDHAMTALKAALGDDSIVELTDKPMTAEDFSYYLDQVPGLYVKLGVAPQDKSIPQFPLHKPRFDIDETSLMTGVRGLAILLLHELQPEQMKMARLWHLQ